MSIDDNQCIGNNAKMESSIIEKLMGTTMNNISISIYLGTIMIDRTRPKSKSSDTGKVGEKGKLKRACYATHW